MSTHLAGRAIVVGAGIAGLSAAAALADYFDEVIVLENDVLPEHAAPRAGTPQSKHGHALLAGGQRFLSALLPGFERDLEQAGAIPFRVSTDYRLEPAGTEPLPQRDLGFIVFGMSRPLIEWVRRTDLPAYCFGCALRGVGRTLMVVCAAD
jgi:2-polyprenyl-6-methoxyphenol hydroxylase-like FAD-dependent oxidoreductase